MAPGMNAPLYTVEILRLAATLPEPRSLDRIDGSSSQRSPTCGSTVATDVKLVDGRIEALSQTVSACAFGQASATLVARQAAGRDREGVAQALADLSAWLSGERNDPLIMYTGTFGQFVYLAKGDADSDASAVEHFGLQVATLVELEAIVDRARARAATDDRVRVTDVHARTTHGPTADYTLTSAYIGFVMPFTVELQHIARVEHS